VSEHLSVTEPAQLRAFLRQALSSWKRATLEAALP